MSNPYEAEIRSARATYNNALAFRDAEAISRYWLLDSQSVWANGKLNRSDRPASTECCRFRQQISRYRNHRMIELTDSARTARQHASGNADHFET
jgi:hypothetical protein